MGSSDRTLFLSDTLVDECAISLVQGESHNLRIHNVSFRLNPLQCAYFIDTKLN